MCNTYHKHGCLYHNYEFHGCMRKVLVQEWVFSVIIQMHVRVICVKRFFTKAQESDKLSI